MYVGPPAAAPPGVPSAARFASPFRRGCPLERRRRYKELLARCPGLASAARQQLRGLSLACWCPPQPCHADILLDAARPRLALLEPGRGAPRYASPAMTTLRCALDAAGAGIPDSAGPAAECAICGLGSVVAGTCDFCGLDAGAGREPAAGAEPGAGPDAGTDAAEEPAAPYTTSVWPAPTSADPFWLGRPPSARPPPPPAPPECSLERLEPAYLSASIRGAYASLEPGSLTLAQARQAFAEQKGFFDAESLLLVSRGLEGPVFVADGELYSREQLCELFLFADMGVAPETVFARQEVGVFAAGKDDLDYVARDAGDARGFAPALDVLQGRTRVPLKVVATRVFVGREAWSEFKAVQALMRGLVVVAAGRRDTPALGPPSGPFAGVLAALMPAQRGALAWSGPARIEPAAAP